MGVCSSIVYSRKQAIEQLVQCKMRQHENDIRNQVSSMTNDEIESELSGFLYASLFNAIIEDE